MDSPRRSESAYEAEASTRAIDFAGRGVHEAARIGSLAEGGQILASVNCEGRGDALSGVSPTYGHPRGVSQPVNVVTIEWM